MLCITLPALHCNATQQHINISIACDSVNLTQFSMFDESCVKNENVSVTVTNCIFVNDSYSVDNDTIKPLRRLTNIIGEFQSIYDSECGANINMNDSNVHMTFDIGYPLYAETIITNNEQQGAICCRGSRSCAYLNALYSNVGNIFCVASFACGETQSIWTGDYNPYGEPSVTGTIDQAQHQVTIYCMAYLACYKSDLVSAKRIICAGHLACSHAIASAQQLYCTYSACNNAILRQVQIAYIYDEQKGITVYSGGIGEMTIFLDGTNAAYGLSLICAQGDTCHIDCGTGACNSVSTNITCYGKCFVTCDGMEGDASCVNILFSMAPSTSPTLIPSNAPTIAPTDKQYILTERELNYWFNTMILSLSIVITLIVAVGWLDAKKIRKNELFKWNAIIACGFYSADFFSDIFFCIKLFLNMMAIQDNTQKDIQLKYSIIFTILFYSSIAFTIIPLLVTLIQLHKQLSKWVVDPILARTEAPVWILSFVKFLYVVSIISGSSFSSVMFFNSNLFQWKIFTMGLSKFHQKTFRNKRFFSIVLLEVCIYICVLLIELYVVCTLFYKPIQLIERATTDNSNYFFVYIV